MNSSSALEISELARDFGLRSVAQDTLKFEVHGEVYTRPYCQANALGKSLMLARSMLLAGIEAAPGIELRETLALVTQHLRLLALPIDWADAESYLMEAF